MEDAATAEICRSQIWQWINSPKGMLDDGRNIDITLFRQVLDEELEKVSGPDGKGVDRALYERAAKIIDQLATGKKFADFLTLPAYEQLR
jgi:malate synthase